VKIVLDTNVIVSGHISRRGALGRVFDLWEQRWFDVLVTAAVLDEYADVLSRPSIQRHTGMSAEDVQATIDDIAEFTIHLDPEQVVIGPSVDPDDDVFLECALAGSADYIVSGDRHLLELGTFHGIPIVTPALFAAILDHEVDQ
jgi:putative PIN family toxin of toxin-antitoxin system